MESYTVCLKSKKYLTNSMKEEEYLQTEDFLKFEVRDRQSFIQFIYLLREELRICPNGWENNNLLDFLEAIERYANDIQGYYDNTNQKVNADEPSWRTFADIFKGSTMYE
jgi:hypothetical protein